jgi:uncharacterized protein
MTLPNKISRRSFVQRGSLAAAAACGTPLRGTAKSSEPLPYATSLQEFDYGAVTLNSDAHESQRRETHQVLMELSEDSLLKPLRQMSGQPAPGEDLGGWNHYDADYDAHPGDDGFAPACTFGQWVSALARNYAITGDAATRDKVLRLNQLYVKTITGDFYENNRFPAYCYDKFVCGLMDAHKYVRDPDAFAILEHTTNTAVPHLPGKAIEHGVRWRKNPADFYTWDESYTISENLFLAYQRGAGKRYRELGVQYLDNTYYDPLSEGRNVLAGRHAYSYVNSLSSAMQAYLTLGSEKHLRAARNAFEMLLTQSYATGGWGPDEQLRAPGSNDLADSLTKTHASFETPCGSYAHFKLTRYLLRVSRDAHYGDSMERVMYNTILGAKPLLADGRTFYYADCNFHAHKFYKDARWPCCSGTMPQVTADYRINTYFHSGNEVYVNLYIPSTVQWTQEGTQVTLRQSGDYPSAEGVSFELSTAKPVDVAVHLRIPAWAEGAGVAVNGKQVEGAAVPGAFAKVRRTWKNGDRIELTLPQKLRLESLDANHPNAVALLSGPLVLFAITDARKDATPTLSRPQLLAAKRTGPQSWQAPADGGAMTFLPFTAIADEQYSTYLIVG